LLLPGFSATAAQQSVETRISSTQVRAGEPVTLQIRLRGALRSAEPDLAPLEEHFQVLDVGRSRRETFINGAHDSSVDWNLTLLPLEQGEVTVPPLRVGQATTAPVTLRVSAPAQAQTPSAGAPGSAAATRAAPGESVFVRTTVEEPRPYEEQRVLLRVRVYAGPELLEGTLGEPEVAGATVERLGDDRNFEEQIGGRSYRGVERTYSLVPEAAGKLVVPPVAFEGIVRVDRARQQPRRRGRRPGMGGFGSSFFDDFFADSPFGDDLFDRFFDRGRQRVVARSRPLELQVRPRPNAARGQWWLPARSVELEESWQPANGRIRVGDAVTRRITLRAEGAAAVQLPPISAPEVAGIKQYAEAPRTSEDERGSIRIQEETLIATEPGPVTLPPIEVAWWDVRSDSARTATLSAHTLDVLPAAGGPSRGGPQPAPVPGGSAGARSSAPAPPAAGGESALGGASGLLPSLPTLPIPGGWLGPIAVLLGALAALLFVAVRRRGARRHARSLRAAERALRRACRRADASAAEQALRDVAALRSGGGDGTGLPRDLEAWARELGGEALARAVAQLRAVRYSQAGERWNGETLWKSYRAARKRRRSARTQRPGGGLPPLYPEGSDARGAH